MPPPLAPKYHSRNDIWSERVDCPACGARRIRLHASRRISEDLGSWVHDRPAGTPPCLIKRKDSGIEPDPDFIPPALGADEADARP